MTELNLAQPDLRGVVGEDRFDIAEIETLDDTPALRRAIDEKFHRARYELCRRKPPARHRAPKAAPDRYHVFLRLALRIAHHRTKLRRLPVDADHSNMYIHMLYFYQIFLSDG